MTKIIQTLKKKIPDQEDVTMRENVNDPWKMEKYQVPREGEMTEIVNTKTIKKMTEDMMTEDVMTAEVTDIIKMKDIQTDVTMTENVIVTDMKKMEIMKGPVDVRTGDGNDREKMSQLTKNKTNWRLT